MNWKEDKKYVMHPFQIEEKGIEVAVGLLLRVACEGLDVLFRHPNDRVAIIEWYVSSTRIL